MTLSPTVPGRLVHLRDPARLLRPGGDLVPAVDLRPPARRQVNKSADKSKQMMNVNKLSVPRRQHQRLHHPDHALWRAQGRVRHRGHPGSLSSRYENFPFTHLPGQFGPIGWNGWGEKQHWQ